MSRNRPLFLLGCVLLLGLAVGLSPAGAKGSLSIDLAIGDHGPSGAKPDIYLSLVHASAGQYFSFTAFQSCSGYYQRPAELVAALYLARETGRPPRSILQARRGKGWGRMAKEMGVHPGYWAKGKSKGHKKHQQDEYWDDGEFETRLYLRYLGDYYGMDGNGLTIWLHRGLSQGDLLIGLNLAARAHRPAAAVLDLRLRGLTWTAIAVRFHENPSYLGRAVPPCRRWQPWGGEKGWDEDRDD